MTSAGPAPISPIQPKSTAKLGKQITAKQVAREDSLEESFQVGFNPAAVERQQAFRNRSRTLGQRKKTEKAETQRVKEVTKKSEEDLAEDFSHRNQELDSNTLINLRRSLVDGDSAEDVLEKISTVVRDPTLVDEVMEYLERTSEGDLLSSVQQARQIHFEGNEREIIAGRNVDAAAKYFHKQGVGENPTELRDLYRDITGNPRDHNVLFSELSTKYEFKELETVVAFLLKGLSYDLKSKGSSIQKPELMRLLTETRNLQSILWVHLFFRSRIKPIKALFAQSELAYPGSVNFQHLAKLYINLVDQRYPSMVKLLGDIEKMGFQSDVEKSIILNQLRDATRALSPRLYQSNPHRQKLRLLILESLEEVEAEEEEGAEEA